MAKFELSDQQMQSLAVFLNRVDLKGAEVSAFNQILQVFSNPLKDESVADSSFKEEKA